jgi:hypothetical protein
VISEHGSTDASGFALDVWLLSAVVGGVELSATGLPLLVDEQALRPMAATAISGKTSMR